MARIAPALTDLLREISTTGVSMFQAVYGRSAERELRALLAVAMAAKSVARVDEGGGRVGDDAPPLDYWAPLAKLHRALARLEPRGKRGRR